MKTAFFGGFNKRDEEFEIENFTLDFERKEIPKNCRHIKNAFVEIINNILKLKEQDHNSYQKYISNKIIHKYKEFVKFYKFHIKNKGHEDCVELLNIILQPMI